MAIQFFDEAYYLRMNKDVATAVAAGRFTAEEHFTKFGSAEKRNPNGSFDANYYIAKYSDVATAVTAKKTTAYDHFLNNGIKEQRDPSAFFDTNYYLKSNPDLAVLVYRNEVTPFDYFSLVGRVTGKSPSPYFDQAAYLAVNPDIKSAIASGKVSNAFDHFVNYGIAEGRNLGNGIDLSFFKSDKTFTDAIFAGKFSAAFARVTEVAPFISGFTLPSNSGVDVAKLTVPVDFTPPTGQLLYIPVGLDTTGKTLPGYFISPNSPKITALAPADDASGVDLKANLVITFNKEMQIGTSGTLSLYKSDGTLVEVFNVKSSQVKVATTKLTIDPTSDLSGTDSYYIKMDSGFVKDKDGNNFIGVSDATTYNFSTGKSFAVTNTGGLISVTGAATALVTADLTAQTVNGAAVPGNPSNNINLSGVTGFGVNVTGSTADNTIVGTSQADTIEGGDGADIISGGAGINTFAFTTTSTKTPSATKFDTIMDWRTGTDNRIDFSAALVLGTQGAPAGAGSALIDTKGVATFTAADTTLTQHIAAVATALNGQDKSVAIWQEGADAFVFISDGTAAISANDVLIKLVGVTVGANGLTIAGGDLTQIA